MLAPGRSSLVYGVVTSWRLAPRHADTLGMCLQSGSGLFSRNLASGGWSLGFHPTAMISVPRYLLRFVSKSHSPPTACLTAQRHLQLNLTLNLYVNCERPPNSLPFFSRFFANSVFMWWDFLLERDVELQVTLSC